MRFLPLLLLLAGCAAPDPGRIGREEAALDRELAGRTAGRPQSCLPVPLGPGSLQAANPRTLVYRQGGTVWVNRLRAPCPSLRPLSTIIIEVRTGQYCRNDRFRAAQPGDIIAGPTCFLGDFVPYRAVSR